jgi:hypothetical protein
MKVFMEEVIMDEMERKELNKKLEKFTKEELDDAKSIVEKSNVIGELLSEITVNIVENNGYDEQVPLLAMTYALKVMILLFEERGGLGDETRKSFVENTLVPFIMDE